MRKENKEKGIENELEIKIRWRKGRRGYFNDLNNFGGHKETLLSY